MVEAKWYQHQVVSVVRQLPVEVKVWFSYGYDDDCLMIIRNFNENLVIFYHNLYL